MQRPADGAFIHTQVGSDLGDVFIVEIVGHQNLLLSLGQFLSDHPVYPFALYFGGQAKGGHIFKKCIFHCDSSPFRSSVRSIRPVRSFGSAWESVRGSAG